MVIIYFFFMALTGYYVAGKTAQQACLQFKLGLIFLKVFEN